MVVYGGDDFFGNLERGNWELLGVPVVTQCDWIFFWFG